MKFSSKIKKKNANLKRRIMTEDFVTVEITQKLKEKGYPLLRVIKQNGSPVIYDLPKNHPNWQNSKVYFVPTVFQVLKWLRDKLEIDLLPVVAIQWTDNLNRVRTYSCSIYSPKLNKPIETEYFDSYEEAIFSGIGYILDNLI